MTHKPEEWTQADAEKWSAVFASHHADVLAQQRDVDAIKEALRRYLDLNDLDALTDGETGLGIELGPAPTKVTWDLKSAPVELLAALAQRGVLKIDNVSFNALRRGGGGTDLDDALRYRLVGEGTRPLRVKVDA